MPTQCCGSYTHNFFLPDPSADCERFYDALNPRVCTPITVEIEVRENGVDANENGASMTSSSSPSSTSTVPLLAETEKIVHIQRPASPPHVTQNGDSSSWPVPLLVTHFYASDEDAPHSYEELKRTLLSSWTVGVNCRATRTNMRSTDSATMYGVSELYTYKDEFGCVESVYEVEQ